MGEKWVIRHPRRVTGRTVQKDITFDDFKEAVLLFTYEKNGWAKSGSLSSIIGHLRGLLGDALGIATVSGLSVALCRAS